MESEEWRQDNYEECVEKFLETKKLTDEFLKFCEEEYNESEQNNADFLYECQKDDKAEQDYENGKVEEHENKMEEKK